MGDPLTGLFFHGHPDPGFLVHSLRQWRPVALGHHPILTGEPRDLRERSPHDSDRYAVVIPRRAERAWLWGGPGGVITQLPEGTIDDINAGIASLAADYSNEAGSAADIVAMEEALAARGVSRWEHIHYIAQDRELADHRGRVRYVPYDALLPMTARHLQSLLDGEAEARMAASALTGDRSLVLCLNATPRPHRLWMAAQLLHLGVFDESLVSFPDWDYVKTAVSDPGIVLDEMAGGRLGYLVDAARQVLARVPLVVDGFTQRGNDLMFAVDLSTYERSMLSVVTETGVSSGRRRITEKSLKAAGLGHPFLVLGHPGSVALLESWGFSAFREVIDHGYDKLDDPVDRLEAIGREILRVRTLLGEDSRGVLRVLAAEGARNRAWLREGFLDAYASSTAVPAVDSLYSANALR